MAIRVRHALRPIVSEVKHREEMEAILAFDKKVAFMMQSAVLQSSDVPPLLTRETRFAIAERHQISCIRLQHLNGFQAINVYKGFHTTSHHHQLFTMFGV